MEISLNTTVVSDGCVDLAWTAGSARIRNVRLLVVRTGSVCAYTALLLSGETASYRIQNLSRHQRYLIAVLVTTPHGLLASEWVSVTPRLGVEPRIGEVAAGLEAHLATVRRFMVMPQDGRVTAYWEITPGFVDQLQLEVHSGDRPAKRLVLEPELKSISLQNDRGVRIDNHREVRLQITPSFAGMLKGGSPMVECTPAPQNQERQANRAHPQEHLIYPTLSLSPELCVFPEEGQTEPASGARELVCCHCRRRVQWDAYRLVCSSCGTEFIPNGRGDFLEVSRLRFGTCQCCLPKKILVVANGSGTLRCIHSGKEHIRRPDGEGYLLIEDLPYGLCQCCRPRRPLVKKGETIRCSKTDEKHTAQDGRYLWVPSEPVFDAAAIDELLDAGLAEICSTGVSRGRR